MTGAPSRRRRILRAAAAIVGLAALYYLVTLVQVWRTGAADEAGSADAIVVLGAAQYDGVPSPQLAARLDHAADLFADGVAPVVVVTGGKQPLDRYTEAGASALYLVAAGVDASAIVQEDQGRSTWESLEGAAALLRDRRLSDVVLVTDPFHALRTRLIADEVGLDAHVSPTRTSPVGGASAFAKHLKEAFGVAVGRIIGFERLWRVTG